MFDLYIFLVIIIIWSLLVIYATIRHMCLKTENKTNTNNQSICDNVWNCMSQPYVYKHAIRVNTKNKSIGDQNIPDDRYALFDGIRAMAHFLSFIHHFVGTIFLYRKDNVEYLNSSSIFGSYRGWLVFIYFVFI